MKKFVTVLLAVCLLTAALAGCASSAKTDDKTIVVGASSTPHAEILAQVKDALAKDGWTLEVKVFDDYVLPNKALNDGELDANYFQHTPYLESFNAANGTDLFESDGKFDTFSTVACLYAETCQIIASADSGIQTVADLKGKTVSVGDAGSGVEFNATQILAAYGIDINSDIKKVNASFGDSADSIKDGKIDAAFTVAGAPTTAIVDYATTNTLNLVSLSDDELAAIQEAYPFLIRDDLAAGTYTGQDADVTCVAIQATLVASEELSEDVVYEFVKAMFDNKDALTEGHAKFGFLDPEAASAGATVTMHPGAEKYYKEIGVL